MMSRYSMRAKKNKNIVDEYEKTQKIGQGTYGIVYKAKNINTNEIVALKKIKFDDDDEGIPSTALREVSLLKELQHNNIVNLKKVIFYESQLYLVFEYLNHDLKKHLKNYGKKFSNKEIKSYVYQILLGIQHCHENRILHRDLKPQNILVDTTNNDKHVLKLADFGLARTYNLPNKTWTHEVITLWYRPPEILLGCKVYSIYVDIWSIACIFIELINGKPVFKGDSQICQLMHIFKVMGTPTRDNNIWNDVFKLKYFQHTFPKWKPKNIKTVVPNLNQFGCDLLAKMLVLDPKKRITSKQALKHPYFNDVIY